jgi:hypothetical protein
LSLVQFQPSNEVKHALSSYINTILSIWSHYIGKTATILASRRPTEPTIAGRPPHRRTPPLDHHRHRDRALVSLPPSLAPNRDHRRPGLLPGRFPADPWLPAGRIWPVSCRRRGEFPLPYFVGHGLKHPRGWAAWPSRPSRVVGWAYVHNALSFIYWFLLN